MWGQPGTLRSGLTTTRPARSMLQPVFWAILAPKGEAAGTAPARPNWQLFDLGVDYGETTDVAAQHPEVVGELVAKHDAWWKECRPLMVNEGVKGPAENPFKVMYREQMGK